MPPPPPTAALFDLDGTLVATLRLYFDAFAYALEPVFGRRLSREEMAVHHPRSEVRFLRELSGDENHPWVMERFYRHYAERHDEAFEGIYPGIPGMLDRLRAAEVPIGMVTGKSRRSWEITGPRIDLGEFPVKIFDDDVPAAKPDPTGLRLAVEGLGREPDEVIYVGDSPTDLEAARRAGMRPGGVLWSKRDGERESFRELAIEMGGLAFDAPDQVVELLLDARTDART